MKPIHFLTFVFSPTVFLFRVIVAVSFLTGALALTAESNWPNWRGPKLNGSTTEGQYPVKWDADKVLWKTALPGKGCSTPIVWNERIYVTSPVDGRDAVMALDWDGEELWQTRFGPESPGKHRNGSGSNASPVTDGNGIYVYFKSGTLAALEMDGSVRWQTNLVAAYGKDTLFWDHGTSPVLTQDAVVMTRMHHGDSWLIAFAKGSGKMLWKADRNFVTPTEGDHSYATPLVLSRDGKEMVVVWGAEHVTAHDARDGSVAWTCGDFNVEERGYLPAVASAVAVPDHNMLVVPHGRDDRGKARVHGIRMGGEGNVTKSHRAWKRDDGGAFVPTPAEYQGRVYFVQDRGGVTCLDPVSGEILWQDAFPRASSSYYASPTLADGKLYAAREDGVIFVADVRDGFSLLAENDMEDRVIASPVPVGNRLLIRGENFLYCVTSQP